jgi:hypothetical protein
VSDSYGQLGLTTHTGGQQRRPPKHAGPHDPDEQVASQRPHELPSVSREQLIVSFDVDELQLPDDEHVYEVTVRLRVPVSSHVLV